MFQSTASSSYLIFLSEKTQRWMSFLLFIFIAGLFFTHLLIQFAATLYFLIFLLILINRKSFTFKSIYYLVISYAISGIVSFLFAGANVNKLNTLMPHFFLLSLITISIWINRKRVFRLDLWLKVIVILATINAVVAIIYHYLGKERATGIFGGYFTLASLMGWSLPLTAGLFFWQKNKLQWLYVPSMFLQIMAIWWSFTRSAMLGVFVGFSCWFTVEFFRSWRMKIKHNNILYFKWTVIILLLVLLLLQIFTSKDPRINPMSRQTAILEQNTDLTSGRRSIIEDAYSILKRDWDNQYYLHYIIGYGLYCRHRLVESMYSSWESDYLQAFMDQGIIGLMIIILIILIFSRLIVRGLLHENYLLNGLATSGVVMVIMSFMTLKFTSWHSGSIFLLLYAFLDRELGHKKVIPLSK